MSINEAQVQAMHEKLEGWYKLRAEVGRDPQCNFSINTNYSVIQGGPAAELMSKEEWEAFCQNNVTDEQGNTSLIDMNEEMKNIESELALKLADLEKQINAEAAKMGIAFDSKTGAVSVDYEAAKNAPITPETANMMKALGMTPLEVTEPGKEAIENFNGVTAKDAVKNLNEISNSDTSEISAEVPTKDMEEKNEGIPNDDGINPASGVEQGLSAANLEEKRSVPVAISSNHHQQDVQAGVPNIKDMVESAKARPAILQQINEKKEELLDRDVKAKKVLDARGNLEVAKDKMDMNVAMFAAKKHALELELAQMKLALMNAASAGDITQVQALQMGMQSICDRIAKLENDFAHLTDAHEVELGGAIMSLENAQKTFENIPKQGGINKSVHQNITYSDEGIMNGFETDVTKNGITLHEQEICDERGIMICDVSDVIQRSTSINIEGHVVEIRTTVGKQNDIQDSAYVAGVEKVTMETEPDGDINISQDTVYANMSDTSITLNSVERPEEEKESIISFMGKVYWANQLGAVPPQEAMLLQKCFRPFYTSKDTRKLDNPANFSKSMMELGVVFELLNEFEKEKETENNLNPYEEIPSPFGNQNQN